MVLYSSAATLRRVAISLVVRGVELMLLPLSMKNNNERVLQFKQKPIFLW